jgi:superfamily I DNA/RNA helicase
MKFDLSSLNPEQREAVQTIDGPLLVLAGAGTGKTKVITTRISWMVAHGVQPGHILAVTFTNKAAREMRERIAGLVTAEAAEQLTVGTFHSFCIRLLRKYIARLGYSSQFGIADETYQADLLRTVLAELKIGGEGCNPSLWQSLISKAKGERIGPDEFAGWCRAPRVHDIADAYRLYQQRMKQMSLVDFDDILCLVLELWEKHPDVLDAHRHQYQYLLVDEYQDTNGIQFNLVAKLAAPRNNLCVVGDDDQSIYAWRGADVTNILSFATHFPGAKSIRLEQNYRSTGNILEAANQVIACNQARHPKRLWTPQGAGDKLMVVRCQTAEAEASFAVTYIKTRLQQFNNDYGQFAILFRSNHQSRLLEQAFRRAHIPYSLIGTSSFFKRKEIQDVLSMLQLIANPHDDLSLLRIVNVPPRGVGDKSLDRLHQFRQATGVPMRQLICNPDFLDELPARTVENLRGFTAILETFAERFAKGASLTDGVRDLILATGYRDAMPQMYTPREDAMRRIENIDEFLSYISDFETKRRGATLKELLDAFTLMDASDRDEDGHEELKGKVSLITVHSSKGLEFPAVVIVGMEHEIFPNQRAVEENMTEEERRLFYVAITRARRECVLTYSDLRKVRGHLSRRRPSRFLDELPDHLCQCSSPEKAFAAATAAELAEIIAAVRANLEKP